MLNSDSSHRLLHCILHLGYQAKFKVPVLEDRVAITNKKLVDKLENYHGLTTWCTLHIALPLSLLELVVKISNQQKKILTTIKTAEQTLSPVNSPLPDDFSQFFVPWIPLHSGYLMGCLMGGEGRGGNLHVHPKRSSCSTSRYLYL